MRLLPLLLSLTIPLAGGGAAATRIEVAIEGGKPLAGAEKIIPYGTLETRFAVIPPPGLVRYRLAGLEPDWIQRQGEMFLLVRFHNAKGDQIAQQSFLVKGLSRGWNGSGETSLPTDRAEKITVPPDAHDISIAISSAGPATAVGTYAITRLLVSSPGGPGREPRELIGDSTATVWAKGGTRPSMAFTRAGNRGAPVHEIHDTDTTGHADWKTVVNASSRVIPGETLDLHWQEYFCTGMGDAFSVTYPRLPSGSYRFEVEALGYSGEPRGERVALSIRVAPPYWRNPWFWAALALMVATGSTLWARHLIRKKIRLHLRQAQLIADERLRIARDLHDGLGARLSHISLLGSHAMGSTADPVSRQKFQEIASMSRELVTSLSETVWMLNSKNDHLDSLINYLCRMVGELCRPLDIRCRIDAASLAADPPVSGELRHHVSMAVKEAVNNALKHSGCSEIRLKIEVQAAALEISVADNGSGLRQEEHPSGNGLENIRQRMGTLEGSLRIGKSPEGGVAIHLRVPL